MSEDLTKKLPKTDSEKLSLILTTVQKLETRVDNLELKVEERLYDTRPIWQKVVADIAQLQEGQAQLHEGQTRLQEGLAQLHEGQARLQEGQDRLEGEMRDVKITMRNAVRHVEILNDTVLKIQGEYRDFSHRVLDIELEHQKQRNSQT
jgi:uncharacterized phage infection (PIP) family protein YhgE